MHDMNFQSLRILGKKWKVKAVPKRFKVAEFEALGSCDVEKCLIKVSTHVDRQQIAETMLHELIHAVDETIGLEMSEAQVHGLSAGLYSVFTDNKKLRNWMFNG